MRKIKLTLLLSFIYLFAFGQLSTTKCFTSCKSGNYSTIIGQSGSNINIQFENAIGEQVTPQTASFSIQMQTPDGEYKDLSLADGNPNNSIEDKGCQRGWYDVTLDFSTSASGLTIVSIDMCPPRGNIDMTEITKKVGDDECDTNDYFVIVRNVVLHFPLKSECSSDASYCYCTSNRRGFFNDNSIFISQNSLDGFLNISIDNSILVNNSNLEMVLLDFAGREVFYNYLMQSQSSFNVDLMENGFYLVVIKNEKEILKTQKVAIF